MTKAACLAVLLAVPASADVVVLDRGVELEGVLVERSGARLELQVSYDGFVEFLPSEVSEVRTGTRERNLELRVAWAKERERAAAEEAARTREEERLRASGWVRHEGEWLKAEELDRRLRAEELALERLRLERPPQAALPVRVEVRVQVPSSPWQFVTRPSAPLRNPAAPSAPLFRPLRVPGPGDLYMNSGIGYFNF